MQIQHITEFSILTLMIPAAVLICFILRKFVLFLKTKFVLQQSKVTKNLHTNCGFSRIGMKLGKMEQRRFLESCSIKNSMMTIS